MADAREGAESTETSQGPSLKDKYAPKAKVDQLVDLTDCDRDFAINVLIQCYGDVKKAQSFIQDDPGYKKDLWHCAECNAANIHDKCHKCGLTKRESVQLSRAREQMREKEKR